MAIPRFAYHSSIGGHLDDFHFLALMNKAAMNISVHVFLWMFVFISLGYISRERTAGSHGNSMFKLLRNCQNVVQRGSTIEHSHQQQ